MEQSLPPLLGAQVNLFCSDPESALAFYTALGTSEVFRFPPSGRPEHIEVDAAGVRIGLTAVAAARRVATIGALTSESAASTEVVFWCRDVVVLHDRALAAGAEEIVTPRRSPDDRLRYS